MPIRPRSGLALNYGISIVNSPGTVDADYRGEIGIILINLGENDFTVNDGDRIAQMVIKKYTRVEWEPAERPTAPNVKTAVSDTQAKTDI